MSIIPPAAVSTAQLVSSAVAAAKTIRDLLKDTQNHELKAAISDLYDEIIDVKARVLDLDEENRKLRAELERREEVTGPIPPHGYYFESSDVEQEHPLCPKCFQAEPRILGFLSKPFFSKGEGYLRQCKLCSHFLSTTE